MNITTTAALSQPVFQGIRTSVRFQGQAEQDAFYKELSAFPKESKERLAEINKHKDSPKHIRLTGQYALVDKNIRHLGKQIAKLVAARKIGDENQKAVAKEHLTDLRIAMDKVLKEFADEQQK